MNTHADKEQRSKSKSALGDRSRQQNSNSSKLQFEDNRPEVAAQKQLQELAESRAREARPRILTKLTSSQPVQKKDTEAGLFSNLDSGVVKEHQKLSNPAKIKFVAAHGRTAKPPTIQGGGVIQAKMFFVPNKHYLADPNEIGEQQTDQYQRWFTEAVEALPDNANAHDARGAIIESFNQHGLNNIYQLGWAGDRLEDLGSVMNDQSPNLYVQHNVLGVGSIHVNRSDKSHHVRDASGQYMERFVGRSLAPTDLANLQGRNHLRGPNLNDRTTLQHVTGVNDGDFLSFSTDPNDVMNAQGVMFNAAQRGRVDVDLAYMAPGNIHNLSRREGIRANLAPQMGVNARDNLDQIMDAGKARANAERAAGAGVVAGDVGPNRKTAGENNPQQANIPNTHYQAIVDAFRTKEVLLEGAVPFNAITRHYDHSAPNAAGAQATADIAANVAASDALTAAANQTADQAEQIPAVVLAPGYTAEITWLQNQIQPIGQARYLVARLSGNAQNKNARNQQLRALVINEGIRMRDEGREIAQIYQRRAAAGWANSLPANLQTRLQLIVNEAAGNFAAIQAPAV